MVTIDATVLSSLVVMAAGFWVTIAYITYAKIGGEKNATQFVATQKSIVDHIGQATELVSLLDSHAQAKSSEKDMHANVVEAHTTMGIQAQQEANIAVALSAAISSAAKVASESLPASAKQS